ncbi:MAG: hypothetical protein J07AB43_13090 [Candidatus Nanosalina sp. J07AB43]|nr:MAG: hypothetical protein J07AB43_13090 [Candidatus Nanosalina sp. J07AB43]
MVKVLKASADFDTGFTEYLEENYDLEDEEMSSLSVSDGRHDDLGEALEDPNDIDHNEATLLQVPRNIYEDDDGVIDYEALIDDIEEYRESTQF